MTIDDPVFLSRYTRQGSVCAFLYGKAHEFGQRHQAPQENRGSMTILY
jgi:hypothetical protein